MLQYWVMLSNNGDISLILGTKLVNSNQYWVDAGQQLISVMFNTGAPLCRWLILAAPHLYAYKHNTYHALRSL